MHTRELQNLVSYMRTPGREQGKETTKIRQGNHPKRVAMLAVVLKMYSWKCRLVQSRPPVGSKKERKDLRKYKIKSDHLLWVGHRDERKIKGRPARCFSATSGVQGASLMYLKDRKRKRVGTCLPKITSPGEAAAGVTTYSFQ